MATKHQEMQLYSGDGLKLFAQRWAPEGTPLAELVIVHGYFDHSSRYSEVAAAMVAGGIACTALDLRGHGRSEGPRGFIKSFEDYHADLRAVLATVPAGPRFILGHSMGGLVTLDFVGRHAATKDFAGVVITSPMLGFPPVPAAKRIAGDIAAVIYPRLAVPSGLDPNGISRDKAIVEAYVKDPLVFKNATAGWFAESKKAQGRVNGSPRLAFPLLFVWSDSDPIVLPSANRAYAEVVSSPDKTTRERPGALHEVLNETDRAELHALIRDWILAHKG